MSEFRTYYKVKSYLDKSYVLSIKTSCLSFRSVSDDELPFPLKSIDEYISLADKEPKALKLANMRRSLVRSKQVINDLCRCNSFDWFVTLTFGKDNVSNRLDDEETINLFKKWRKSIKRAYPSLTYLAVPEYHKKGGIHFHMLIGGVTHDDLKLSFFKTVTKKDGTTYDIFNVNAWQFGYSTATKIKYPERVCAYICKYISKQDLDIRFYRRNRYYHSDNLIKPYIMRWDTPVAKSEEDYLSDYEIEDMYCCKLVYKDFNKAFRKFESIT